MFYEGKKILAALVTAGAVLFGQATVSEAHAVVVNEPALTFATENFSLNNRPNFNYVAVYKKYVCDRCGEIISVSFTVNPNYPPNGLAYGVLVQAEGIIAVLLLRTLETGIFGSG